MRYEFADSVLDVRARQLTTKGELITIEPKALECLAYLIEHRARAVSRDELISAVWASTDVSDAMLGQALLKARRAIGDDGRCQKSIRTVAKFGYQWIAPLTRVQATCVAACRAGAGATESELRDAKLLGGDRLTKQTVAPAVVGFLAAALVVLFTAFTTS